VTDRQYRLLSGSCFCQCETVSRKCDEFADDHTAHPATLGTIGVYLKVKLYLGEQIDEITKLANEKLNPSATVHCRNSDNFKTENKNQFVQYFDCCYFDKRNINADMPQFLLKQFGYQFLAGNSSTSIENRRLFVTRRSGFQREKFPAELNPAGKLMSLV
jgi:hypothetical protein